MDTKFPMTQFALRACLRPEGADDHVAPALYSISDQATRSCHDAESDLFYGAGQSIAGRSRPRRMGCVWGGARGGCCPDDYRRTTEMCLCAYLPALQQVPTGLETVIRCCLKLLVINGS